MADTQSSFSLAELADQISDPKAVAGPYARPRIHRQIRHWTLAGALIPLGGTFTGTGRHRRYGPESAIVAAVLIELAKLGLTIGTLCSAAAKIYEGTGRSDLRFWKDQLKERTAYLRLAFDLAEDLADPICVTELVLDPSNFQDIRGPIGTSSVIIDLGRLVDGLPDPPRDEAQEAKHNDTQSLWARALSQL